jgi:homoserine dehydrogenase
MKVPLVIRRKRASLPPAFGWHHLTNFDAHSAGQAARRCTVVQFAPSLPDWCDRNEKHFLEQALSNTRPRRAAAANLDSGLRQPPACRVALVGFGTVGRAVVKILCERYDDGLRLTHICNRNVERKKQDWVPSSVAWTSDFEDVLASDANIVVELIGGLSPAKDLVSRALQAGKSVVTANKQLIAHHGPELLELARANGCQLEFGASVAGGVPVLPALRTGLCGDRLHGIAGILNGTCNYILSRIETARIPFGEALEEAQAAGYAEADASEDLDGGDARAKLAILALAGLRVRVSPAEIRARTIRTVDAIDFDYAAELGCTIRQISRADLSDAMLLADVGPSLVPENSPFGRVQRNLNLVMTSGAYGGDVAFLGAGAGGNPTAVAVVSDLMFVAENLSAGRRAQRVLQLASRKVSCDFETPWYLRFWVKDRPGIIASLAAILSEHRLNIDSVLQKPGCDKNALPFVITLEPCRDAQLHPALEKMSALEFCMRPCLCLPILR